MSHAPIGIDLGTSTSEIAFFENGQPFLIQHPRSKSPIVPSLVALERDTWKVGPSAVSLAADPTRCVREVKRLMGTQESVQLQGRSYRPEEISAHILTHLKGVATEFLGTDIRDVVLSVPANFEAPARTATRVAAEIAGLNVVRLINEPTAAALAFGIRNVDLEAQVVVFDFGGGTLDVTVLEMMEGVLDVKASFGDTRLGGKDVDALIIQWMTSKVLAKYPAAKLTERAPGMLRNAAEEAKTQLSAEQSVRIEVPYVARLNGEPLDFEEDLTRAEFNRLIAPLLDRARTCVRSALTAGKVNPSQVDRVILVGGTTYIPAVRQMVSELFGREAKAEVPPDLAVAMGAAVHAASAAGQLHGNADIILADGCPMGLGIDVVAEVGGRRALVYSPLILPNQKVPYSVQKQYSLISPDQRVVNFRLYQDHTGKAVFPEDALDTGIQGQIVDIPPALYGEPHPLTVEFSYDANGEVRVRASIPGINRDCCVAFNGSSLRMSEEEIAAARSRMGSPNAAGPSPNAPELWRSHPKAADFAPLIERAERLLAAVPARERSPMAELVSRLKDALTTGNDSGAEQARHALVQALFDLES